MKRKSLLLAALLVLFGAPAHAIIIDTVIGGINHAKDEAYQAFMKLKIIEEIRILKQNYDASVRYYNEFQRLNSGRGFFYNVANEFKMAGEQMGYDLQARLDRDFIHTYQANTDVDKLFQSVDSRIAHNMKYAGDEVANIIAQRRVGMDIAKSAQGLSPKDAANLAVKAHGLELQMMTQLHEDNLKLIELQTIRLANENRKLAGENQLMETIRQSVVRWTNGKSKETSNGAKPVY